MRLHILCNSPHQGSTFADCLRHASENDAIILIQDAIYAIRQSQLFLDPFHDKGLNIFALRPDCKARGIAVPESSLVKSVDDRGFVDLTASYQAVQSWF